MDTSLTKLCFTSLLIVYLLQDADGLECYCSNCPQERCTITEGACYISMDLSDSAIPTVSGCVTEGLSSLMCGQSDSSFYCCYGNHCNTVNERKRLLRNAGEVTTMKMNDKSMTDSTIAIVIVTCVVSMTIFISLLAAAVCCFLYRRRQRKLRREEDTIEELPTPEVRYTACRAILPQSESIGSLLKAAMFYGGPLSLLVQRSIAQQTFLEKSLYKGTFCHHYIGKWRNDRVGVKVYTGKQERIWFNETQILQLPLMRHENILSFIAADIVNRHDLNYHFLINEHHHKGTLREHLTKTTIEVPNMLTLMTSLVNGLEYIHSELQQLNQAGTMVTKPAIVHRNVSSQSVYVDKSGSCVWGDFSLAVKREHNSQLVRFHPYGDVRYLPPEFLGDTPPQVEFEGLMRGDVYGLGLVMWEVVQCCLVEGENEEYSLPYSDLLMSGDEATPTREEMRNIVCDEKKRPHLPPHCARERNTQYLLHTIQECWSHTPSERPSSQQLKDSLIHSIASQREVPTVDKNGQPIIKQKL